MWHIFFSDDKNEWKYAIVSGHRFYARFSAPSNVTGRDRYDMVFDEYLGDFSIFVILPIQFTPIGILKRPACFYVLYRHFAVLWRANRLEKRINTVPSPLLFSFLGTTSNNSICGCLNWSLIFE